MKQSLFIAALVIAQVAFGQIKPKEIKRLSVAEARENIEKSSLLKKIEEIRKANKNFSSDPTFHAQMTRWVEINLKTKTELSKANSKHIVELIEASPLEVLTEVTRLVSIVKDKNSTPGDIAVAQRNLDLVAKSTNAFSEKSDTMSKAEKKTQVESILKISEKLSSLDLGKAAKDFIVKYEAELAKGKSIAEAIKEASGGKFTEKDLRDCV